jgi:hypothetical protein
MTSVSSSSSTTTLLGLDGIPQLCAEDFLRLVHLQYGMAPGLMQTRPGRRPLSHQLQKDKSEDQSQLSEGEPCSIGSQYLDFL